MSMQFQNGRQSSEGQHGLSLWHEYREQLLRSLISCFEAMMLPIARGVRSLSIAEHCAHVCMKSHVSSLACQLCGNKALPNVAITFMQQRQRVSILGEATLLQLEVKSDFSRKPSL